MSKNNLLHVLAALREKIEEVGDHAFFLDNNFENYEILHEELDMVFDKAEVFQLFGRIIRDDAFIEWMCIFFEHALGGPFAKGSVTDAIGLIVKDERSSLTIKDPYDNTYLPIKNEEPLHYGEGEINTAWVIVTCLEYCRLLATAIDTEMHGKLADRMFIENDVITSVKSEKGLWDTMPTAYGKVVTPAQSLVVTLEKGFVGKTNTKIGFTSMLYDDYLKIVDDMILNHQTTFQKQDMEKDLFSLLNPFHQRSASLSPETKRTPMAVTTLLSVVRFVAHHEHDTCRIGHPDRKFLMVTQYGPVQEDPRNVARSWYVGSHEHVLGTHSKQEQALVRGLHYANVTRVAPRPPKNAGNTKPKSNTSESNTDSKRKPNSCKVVWLPHVVGVGSVNKSPSEPTGKKHIFRGRRETTRNYNHERYVNMRGKSQVIAAIADPQGEALQEVLYAVRKPRGYAEDSEPIK